jgi:hypothetical protein
VALPLADQDHGESNECTDHKRSGNAADDATDRSHTQATSVKGLVD